MACLTCSKPGRLRSSGRVAQVDHPNDPLGTYETNCVPWAIGGTPLDFGHELLQDDLGRVTERLETAFDRTPALGRAGIKKVVNGPFTFGPDGSPLIGPVPGLNNYWAAVLDRAPSRAWRIPQTGRCPWPRRRSRALHG